MLNPSNNSPEQQYRLQPLKQLLHKHPIAVCGGLWVAFLLVGGCAALGLLNPGLNEQETPKPTPAPVTVQVSTPKDDLSLSLFSAIAIGCAAGTLLFTFVLITSAQSRRPSKGLSSVSTVGKKRRHPSQTEPPVSGTVALVPWQPTVQTLDRRRRPEENLTQVTVLAPEESHPLDGRNESLADLLDLRKHQSLASLMRGK